MRNIRSSYGINKKANNSTTNARMSEMQANLDVSESVDNYINHNTVLEVNMLKASQIFQVLA